MDNIDENLSLERFDGTLVNALTGLGGASDRNKYTTVGTAPRLSKYQLEELYRIWICKNIVDAYPKEATREWCTITLGQGESDPKIIADYNKYTNFDSDIDNLSIADAFRQAQKWANLYGGAAIILLIEDGQPFSAPVNLNKIQSIRGVEVLDRHKILPEYTTNFNITKPEYYSILLPTTAIDKLAGATATGTGKERKLVYRIHKSRIIRFDGIEYTPDMMAQNSGWGGSVLEQIWETLKAHDTGYAAISNLLSDFSLFVWKLKGLSNLVAAGQEEPLRNRFRAMQASSSVFGGLAIDADSESVDFVSRQLTGIADILEKFREQLIGASGLPHTVLFGESPSGLGATGESEEKTWAKMVAQFQKEAFNKKVRYFSKLVFLAKDGPTKGKEPKDWSITWNSLIQQSDEEKISARSNQSNTDRTYVDMGVLLPEEVRASRFGGSEFSYETVLDEKLWKKKQDEQAFGGFDMGGMGGMPTDMGAPQEEISPEEELDSSETTQTNTDSQTKKDGGRRTEEGKSYSILPPPSFKLPPSQKDLADWIAAKTSTEMTPQIDNWLVEIEKLVKNSSSTEELKSKIALLYEKLPSEEFTRVLTENRILAHLAGKNEVLEEIKNGISE